MVKIECNWNIVRVTKLLDCYHYFQLLLLVLCRVCFFSFFFTFEIPFDHLMHSSSSTIINRIFCIDHFKKKELDKYTRQFNFIAPIQFDEIVLGEKVLECVHWIGYEILWRCSRSLTGNWILIFIALDSWYHSKSIFFHQQIKENNK